MSALVLHPVDVQRQPLAVEERWTKELLEEPHQDDL